MTAPEPDPIAFADQLKAELALRADVLGHYRRELLSAGFSGKQAFKLCSWRDQMSVLRAVGSDPDDWS